MAHEVKTVWKDNLAFDSYIDAHTLRMDDSSPPGQDTGPSPKKLLLASLAGCTGMDVVLLLQKMRVPFTGMEVDIHAPLTEEHPRVYSRIELVYRIFGVDLNKAKVEKAVRLSQEKYCGVSEMLRKNSPIDYRIEYEENSP